jgi:hypothetical protein
MRSLTTLLLSHLHYYPLCSTCSSSSAPAITRSIQKLKALGVYYMRLKHRAHCQGFVSTLLYNFHSVFVHKSILSGAQSTLWEGEGNRWNTKAMKRFTIQAYSSLDHYQNPCGCSSITSESSMVFPRQNYYTFSVPWDLPSNPLHCYV